jgi:hypothetical protein
MSLVYGSTHFFIPSGQTWGFTSAINGDTTNGGDYVGPLVALGVPVTTTRVEFLSRNSDGLTSQCVYHYSVTNNNSFGVTLRLDKFYDG